MAKQMFFLEELSGCKLTLFSYGKHFTNFVAVATVGENEVREEWNPENSDPNFSWHLANLVSGVQNHDFTTVRNGSTHVRTLANHAKAAIPSFKVQEPEIKETLEV